MSTCCASALSIFRRGLPPPLELGVGGGVLICYFHGMGCEPDEVSYFVGAWTTCVEELNMTARVLSFAAPPALSTRTLEPANPSLRGRSCKEARPFNGPLRRESRAWYTYQQCESYELSHLDVFCESQLEAVLLQVRRDIRRWVNWDAPPTFILAGSSQGGTVALALAIDLVSRGMTPALVLLYHSTIMQRHLEKALKITPLRIHIQLASTDAVYCPEVVKAQARRLLTVGHQITVAQDRNASWHGGDVDLEPSLRALRTTLLELQDAVPPQALEKDHGRAQWAGEGCADERSEESGQDCRRISSRAVGSAMRRDFSRAFPDEGTDRPLDLQERSRN